MQTVTGFTETEHRAIERFLTARTVPLCYQKGETAFVQGTGTFYRCSTGLFLVTAAHVLDGIEPELLGVPDHPSGNVSVWNLGDITIHHPRDTENFDVAFIELLNSNFHARVASSWGFIDECEVIEPEATQDSFLVAGYPTSQVEYRDGTLVPQPMLQLFTSRYDGPTDEPVPEYDLLLKYPKLGRTLRGEIRETPKLQGVSGAAVYGRSVEEPALWSPDRIFRPVGIQVRVKHGEFVRVKRWGLLHHLIQTAHNG